MSTWQQTSGDGRNCGWLSNAVDCVERLLVEVTCCMLCGVLKLGSHCLSLTWRDSYKLRLIVVMTVNCRAVLCRWTVTSAITLQYEWNRTARVGLDSTWRHVAVFESFYFSFCGYFYDIVIHWRVLELLLHAGHPVWGRGTPLPPLSIYLIIFSPFHFSLSFIGFTHFLLLSIPSLSTRIVPLRFQAGGCRRRPNLGLVCVLFCTLCYLYSLVRCIVVLCCIWFSVFCVPSVLWHCWLGHLTRKNPSPYDL